MKLTRTDTDLAHDVQEYLLKGFTPHFDRLREEFPSHKTWDRLTDLGTELWLDSGDAEAVQELWTQEFTALTTNNTLLNREVQKGTYDEVIPEMAALLDRYALDERQRRLELAFMLNAAHALMLVERFDAYVSVEEHTDLASDVALAVDYARRYHAVCPERFIVKIPFTPAGLIVTRILSDESLPVNHTLGFAARQNYIIARIARPEYVNVFMGRLNSFVADNDLGDGSYVGERATLASQAVIDSLRGRENCPSRQIGASYRQAEQVRDLSGIDVMTMPPKVARGLLDMALAPDDLKDRTDEQYTPGLRVDEREYGLQTLWEVNDDVIACADALSHTDVAAMSPDALVAFFVDHNCGDVLVNWSDAEIARSYEEGKIPKLDNWRGDLESGRIGLDALMNLAGLNSFTADQKEMDDKVAQTLAG